MGLSERKINHSCPSLHCTPMAPLSCRAQGSLCHLPRSQKAFDTVPHRLLINKLSEIGLSDFIVHWICSYLTDRKQVVVLNGCSSAKCNVRSGVPQGSVLGPILFLLYINGLEEVPLSAGTKFVLYADDTLVYKPICSLHDHHLFQLDLNAISNWLAQNCMTLNGAKC